MNENLFRFKIVDGILHLLQNFINTGIKSQKVAFDILEEQVKNNNLSGLEYHFVRKMILENFDSYIQPKKKADYDKVSELRKFLEQEKKIGLPKQIAIEVLEEWADREGFSIQQFRALEKTINQLYEQ